MGLDQRTLESLVNDNKDNAQAEDGFAAGQNLYDGTTAGASALVLKDMALDQAFFQVSGGTTFFPTFQRFVDYYSPTYMDQHSVAGFDGVDATFPSGASPTWEYSVYDAFGRADVIEKATAYMIVAQYVQGSLEKAVEQCIAGNSGNALNFLDDAVAFYKGQETVDGNGPFFFNLAISRCGNFGVCTSPGVAPVNTDIFAEFTSLRSSLNTEAGTDCPNSAASVTTIVNKMAIPLIQGTLRYAVFIGLDNLQDDKTKSEGAIFAASVLPYIHECSPAQATIIFDQMKPVAGTQEVDFKTVQQAFEACYNDFDITIEDIGCYDGRFETCPTGWPTSAPSMSPPTGSPPTGSPPTGGPTSSAMIATTSTFATVAAVVAAGVMTAAFEV